jgi:uncharacterized protein (TIGR02996 family)
MTRLELVEGTSRKFWEAHIQGKRLIVRWGRIGTAGQSKAKVFASAAAAEKERAALVAAKTKKGYRDETSQAAKPRAAAPKKPAATSKKPLKLKEPANVAGWLVYADALIERSDPRGELIVLEERLARTPGDAALRRRRKSLLGTLALETSGAVARGVIVAGGGTTRGRSMPERIQDAILDAYSLAHLITFARAAGAGRMDAARVASKVGAELPESFLAFHRWARALAGRFPHEVAAIEIPEGAFFPASLDNVVSDTEMWRRIQREQPDREWLSGFVHLASWDGAYEMVIDTKAEVTKPKHQLMYWDFKGGSSYSVCHKSFDTYLADILQLVTRRAYFMPPRGDADDEDEGREMVYDEWRETLRGGMAVDFA